MTDAPDIILPVVRAIHATTPRLVLEFAGAGAQALAWLHAVGGSSRTVLEATDRYAAASLIEAVGFTPKRFTSKRVARALAAHARARARQLTGGGEVIFGVGVTATIATDRRKRGRHRCTLAVRDGFGTSGLNLVLHKGASSRRQEEALVSHLIIAAIAAASGVLGVPPAPLLPGEKLEQELLPTPTLARFASGEIPWLLLRPSGRPAAAPPLPQPLIYSGSFNPLHEGHLELAHAAAKLTGRQVIFELPLLNADKAAIPLLEARRRAAQFLGRAPLLLTREPLFTGKARLFPGATFVMGVDTAERLIDPRYYGNDPRRLEAALAGLRAADARFLVAGRQWQGSYRTLRDLAVPRDFTSLFEELPEEAFRRDISSGEIRRSWGS